MGASHLIKKDLFGMCGVCAHPPFSQFMPQQLPLLPAHLSRLAAKIQELDLHLTQQRQRPPSCRF